MAELVGTMVAIIACVRLFQLVTSLVDGSVSGSDK